MKINKPISPTDGLTRANPSAEYTRFLNEYIELHKTKAFDGRSIRKFIGTITGLIHEHQCKTLLDYGAGKGTLYTDEYHKLTDDIDQPLQAYWELDEVALYEPARPGYDRLPYRTFDAVICTDVLEHIPESDLGWVIDELFSKANKLLFLNIATFPAMKTFADGTNVHISVFDYMAWLQFIEPIQKRYPYVTVHAYFDVITEQGTGLSDGYKIEGRDADNQDSVQAKAATA